MAANSGSLPNGEGPMTRRAGASTLRLAAAGSLCRRRGRGGVGRQPVARCTDARVPFGAHRRRKAESERHLAGDQHGALGSSGPSRRSPARSSRSGAGAVPGGHGVVEGNEIPYQPCGAREEAARTPPTGWRGSARSSATCRACRAPRICRYPFQIVQSASAILIAYEFASATARST